MGPSLFPLPDPGLRSLVTAQTLSSLLSFSLREASMGFRHQLHIFSQGLVFSKLMSQQNYLQSIKNASEKFTVLQTMESLFFQSPGRPGAEGHGFPQRQCPCYEHIFLFSAWTAFPRKPSTQKITPFISQC